MEFKADLVFNPVNNRHYFNGWGAVLHCHHYATLVTQLALYADQFDGENILKQVSEDIFYSFLNVGKENCKYKSIYMAPVAIKIWRSYKV